MTNQKFFLHIGMHKSASSFLQRKVFTAENKIFSNYKLIVNKKERKKIQKIVINYNKKKISLKKAKMILKKITKNHSKVIISHESLIGYHFDGFKYLSDNYNSMEKLFNKPKYLILFRNQSDFLYSLWLHRIRKGIKITFSEFVTNKNFNNIKVKSPKNYATNYKIYDFNKLFKPYLKILNKRAFLFDIKRIKNSKDFNDIINSFLNETSFEFSKKKLSEKVNISREYELIYSYLFNTCRYMNKLILLSLIFIYKYVLFFIKSDKVNYKHEHFNRLSFFYFNIINFFLKKKLIGKNFLNEINLMKKKINKYYFNSNRTFYNKINVDNSSLLNSPHYYQKKLDKL